MTDSPPLDLRSLIGYRFEPIQFTHTARDAILYALGIGCPADQRELRFVYEQSDDGFAVFPTFAVIYPSQMIDLILANRVPGLTFDPMMLLHGEQLTRIDHPLPYSGTIISEPTITAVYDKGKGALIVVESPSFDQDRQQIAFNRYSFFIRGLGGFGGERGSSDNAITPPDRAPDAVIRQSVGANQALIYRLSGDLNPLHADPQMAARAGFDQPILHGLSTFGYAARHALMAFGECDPARFRQISVRFTRHVFPGETLVTDMWDAGGGQIILQVKAEERGEVVISSAAVKLMDEPLHL
jgi:3-hydroxyacyl-CoA dehydrogenase/3a,7a,12a-trihydroxy-5b-cholest-24-enoyl-CoA hydratase